MTEKRRESVSIVVPAFNESKRIGPTLYRLEEYLKDNFKTHETIVVDDGSTDSTVALVEKAMKELPSVRVVSYAQNRGKGYAVRQGIAASKGDIVLISDADLSTPIEEIEKLLVHYDLGADVVIGSRALRESEIIVRQPWWREYMGRTFNLLVRLLLVKGFKDTQCGFKLFRGEVARRLFSRAVLDGFAFDIEIIYLAMKAGYGVVEVPVRWINSPASRVNPVMAPLQMARDILRIRLQAMQGDKDGNPAQKDAS